MNWIDDSRRVAFERLSSAPLDVNKSELERYLPDDMKSRAIAIGNELTVGYEDALAAINIATKQSIAILGFDAGEVTEQAFQVLDYSGYDRNIGSDENWQAYVADMNAKAERSVKEHPLGRNKGYILTSTSEREFKELKVD